MISAILALMWLWTGLVYHALFFATINGTAYVFAAAFTVEAALIAYAGVLRGRLTFARPSSIGSWVGLSLIAYAGVLYPLIGLLAGNMYPATPMFGITPCPVTIFSFGLLLSNGEAGACLTDRHTGALVSRGRERSLSASGPAGLGAALLRVLECRGALSGAAAARDAMAQAA